MTEEGEATANEEASPPPAAAAADAGEEQQEEENNQANNDDDDSDSDDDDDDDSDSDDDDDDEDPLAHLPDYVIRRVDKLRELDNQRAAVMQDYLRERAALEQKYAALITPLFDERTKIIHGERDEEIDNNSSNDNSQMNGGGGGVGGDVTDETVGESSDSQEETEEGNNASGADASGAGSAGAGSAVAASAVAAAAADAGADAATARVKGIPQFWVCGMTHNETTGELITEDDVDCLESLTNITCHDREDGKGFTLTFYFAPNEYFTNSTLTKAYNVPNLLLSDEPLLKGVTGTKVEWKSDERALTYRMVKKKQRGKGKNAGQVRTVTKKEDLESFFKWFEPPDMPSMDDIDEEEAERLEELFDDDYEVAEAFRSHVIPRAVLWFTGQAEENEITNALLDEDGDDNDNDNNNELAVADE